MHANHVHVCMSTDAHMHIDSTLIHMRDNQRLVKKNTPDLAKLCFHMIYVKITLAKLAYERLQMLMYNVCQQNEP